MRFGMPNGSVHCIRRKGEWSEQDYFSLPETMWFIELVDGVVTFNCYHTPRHQIVLGNLMRGLHIFLDEHPVGQFIQGHMDCGSRKDTFVLQISCLSSMSIRRESLIATFAVHLIGLSR
jgi:hypothetical protein